MPKKTIKKNLKPKVEANFNQPKDYINIYDGKDELSNKTKKLWLIVFIFSFFLISGWLLVLKTSLNEQAKKINFTQLSDEISQSLTKFDTEIKNRDQKIIELNADDIDTIKKEIENRLKNNPDSSNWLEYKLINDQITIKYPENWYQSKETAVSVVINDRQSTSTPLNSGQIEITIKNNQQNYALTDWLIKNKINPIGYQRENPIFKFNSSSSVISFSALSQTTSTLDKIYYFKPEKIKKIYEIKALASGDISYYSPLINEIINTIK